MCTLALVRRAGSRFPVIVAANRDEFVDRPSTGPLVWDDPVRFVAGRDEVAGGTWMGVNEHGLVVGLTNHWTGVPPDPSLASRGDVVRQALQARDLDEVAGWLAGRDPAATNPFLLLAVERSGRAFWTGSTQRLRPHTIENQSFALGNQLPLADPGHRARRLGEGLLEALDGPDDDPDRLRKVLVRRLAHHVGDRGPATSVCVHTDRGFGTVSSTVLLLGAEAGDDRLWSASGPPCTSHFADRTELLRELKG